MSNLVISVGGIKGGSGKSTFAVQLAVFNHEHNLLVVDADPQESVHDWSLVRGGNQSLSTIQVVKKTGELMSMKPIMDSHDIVIVDTGGRDSIELTSSLAISDVFITPVKSSFFDLAVLEALKEKVAMARINNPTLKWILVINQVNPSSNSFANCYLYLNDVTNPKEVFIHPETICSRQVYAESVNQGKSVLECNNPKAVKEIQGLLSTVQEVINERV